MRTALLPNASLSAATYVAHDGGEYLTTRKVETKTTKNTERRVQRQVVLQDGRVIAKTEPEITVDTYEDHQTHEECDVDNGGAIGYNHAGVEALIPHVKWRGHYNGATNDVVEDSFRRTVNTHDVSENVRTTSVANGAMGRVRRRELDRALREKRPINEVLHFVPNSEKPVVVPNPRVVYSSKSRKKIIDTEDVHNISRKLDNGKVLTETFRTEKHEIIDDKESPDDTEKTTSEEEIDHVVRDKQKYSNVKKDEFTEYYRIPKGNDQPELIGRGPQLTTEEKEIKTMGNNAQWDELSDKVRRNRQMMRNRIHAGESAERKDALTKKPLNFHFEEKVKRKETDKWLERHFGSEWSLNTSNNSSGFHHSRLMKHHYDLFNDKANVRRSMSFTSIPIVYHSPPQQEQEEIKTTKERIVKTTTTTYTPGKEKYTFSTVTRSAVPTAALIGPPPPPPPPPAVAAAAASPSPSSPRFKRHHLKTSAVSGTVHSKALHQSSKKSDEQHQRKYNSTLSLLPPPQVDYSLHGGSTITEPVRPPRRNKIAGEVDEDDQKTTDNYLYGDRSFGSTLRTMASTQYQPRTKSAALKEERSRSLGTTTNSTSHRRTVEDRRVYSPVPNEEYSQRSHTLGHKHKSRSKSASTKNNYSNRHYLFEEKYTSSPLGSPNLSSSRQFKTLDRSDYHWKKSHQHHQHQHQYQHQHHHHGKDSSSYKPPLYVTELRRDKLYPATSENNLLFDMHRPRNYLGFRSLERTDAASVHSHNNNTENQTTTTEEDTSSRRSKSRTKERRRRTQSFAANSNHSRLHNENSARQQFFGGKGDEFIYDRFERRFVTAEGASLRHGHSDLRLDRGFRKADFPGQPTYYYYKVGTAKQI